MSAKNLKTSIILYIKYFCILYGMKHTWYKYAWILLGGVTHWGIMLAWIVLGLVILVGTNILLFYLMFQGLTFWWETEIFWWNRVHPPPMVIFFKLRCTVPMSVSKLNQKQNWHHVLRYELVSWECSTNMWRNSKIKWTIVN